jgi:HAE1 family hydrophobic/amphiphilic exporter-1
VNLSAPFIRRPVMTTLVTASFVAFGVASYFKLPVADLPTVDFPTIQVTASLPGANPETMAATVATPLERRFSTIAGLTAMNSNSIQGSTSLSLEFSLERDIDAAAQDVQAAIAASARNLPANLPAPPTLTKVNPADAPILFFALTSPTLPMSQLNRMGQDLIAQRISTVPGVAQVLVYGAQKYAARIQIDPRALSARGIGLDEVTAAIQAANANLPSGALSGASRSWTVEATGGLTSAAEFRRLPVRVRDGVTVRLEDVARVLDGVENDQTAAWYFRGAKEQRSIILAVLRQPGTNTVEVSGGVKALLPLIQRQLPAAATLKLLYDRAESIRASVDDVQFTLLLTLALVVLVIFLFLRNLRATIIPSLALPVSIVGTFALMWALGYSLDNLSLMALTLAVGFVVDDAIVMLENVVRHMERGEERLDATFSGSKEVAFTIVSMTISLAAVFLPVLFMGGIVGRLFREFAVTIGAAILVSGFVSLTLTPLLCARFLRPHSEAERHGRVYKAIERGFDRALAVYDRGLTWSLAHPNRVLVLSAAVLVGMIPLWVIIPKGFLPSEDVGRLQLRAEPAEGTSFEAVSRSLRSAAAIVAAHPAIEELNANVGGRGGLTGSAFVTLKPRSERKHVDVVIQELRRQLANVPGLRIFLSNPPPFRIGAQQSSAQYQFTLQDSDTGVLYEGATQLERRLRELPELTDVTSDLRLSTPRIKVEIDRERAAVLQVSPTAVEEALYTAFGTRQVSQINAPEDQYQVILELAPEFRADPAALSWISVRSASGALVPIEAVARLVRTVAPQQVNHSGQLPAVTLSFNLRPGTSLGQATRAVDAAADQLLPATVTTAFQGTAQAFQASLSGMTLLLVMSIVVIYVVLGILYESFIHPVTILTALPFAGLGAVITLLAFRVELSIYAIVGVIMLVGLVKKNGIMMVDFAIEAQKAGKGAREAIHEACLVRFRPIMMTTMAALMGTLPIALGLGAGAESRQPLGLAVVGGLIFSQFLTLFVTPVFFEVAEGLRHRRPRA